MIRRPAQSIRQTRGCTRALDLKASGVLLTCVILAGCAVGPDFVPPPATTVKAFGSEASMGKGSGPAPDAQFVRTPMWWRQFDSTVLDDWVEEGLSHNQDLRSARMALDRARDVLHGETGLLLLPTVDAGVEPTRQRALNLPHQRPPTVIYDVYAANVDVSYRLDLFGGSRRQIEADAADVDTVRAELDAARLTLVANIVSQAIQSAALQARIAAIEDATTCSEQRLMIENERLASGSTSEDAVLSQQRATNALRQALPALVAAHARAHHALAVLMGRGPAEAPPDLDFASLRMPASVPAVLPAEVIATRPDVVAAVARAHAANARYGEAIANLYPQLTITSSVGSESYAYRTWFTGPQGVYSIAAQLAQPLFRGGALEAAKEAAGIDRNSATVAYEKTVLHALQSVGDALYALDADRVIVSAANDDARAASELADRAERRAQSGSIAPTIALARREDAARARSDDLAARAQQWADLVGYYQAIGRSDDLPPINTPHPD